MRATVAALILGAALVVGCGGDDGGGAADVVEPDVEGIEFVRPPENVPLPDGATAIESSPNFGMYEVKGSTFDDLAGFYRSEFDEDDGWNGWNVCRHSEGPGISSWTFERAGEVLLVDVYEEVKLGTPYDEPAKVVVASGPREEAPATIFNC